MYQRVSVELIALKEWSHMEAYSTINGKPDGDSLLITKPTYSPSV